MPSNPWPKETPEEVIERTRREHGDAVAELVAKAIAGPPPPRKHNRRRKAGERQNLRKVAARGGGSLGRTARHRDDGPSRGARDDAR